MLQLARARLSTLALRPLVRGIAIKAPGYGSPEAEGPLYSHSSAVASVVHGVRKEDSEAEHPHQPAKQRTPNSKNHKVAGGQNFQELRKMHNEGRD